MQVVAIGQHIVGRKKRERANRCVFCVRVIYLTTIENVGSIFRRGAESQGSRAIDKLGPMFCLLCGPGA